MFVAVTSIANAQSTSEIRGALQLPSFSAATLNSVYQNRNFAPIWLLNGQPTQKAYELRQALMSIGVHGLPSGDYWNSELESLFSSGAAALNPASADLKLTSALVTALEHVSVGRVDPKKVSDEIKYDKRSFSIQSLMNIESTPISSLLDAAAPQNEQYQNLKSILAGMRLIESRGGYAALSPTKSTLKIGIKSSVVRDIKSRLYSLGYRISNIDDRFDSQLAEAITQIQKNNLAKPTGALSPNDRASWEYFSISSSRRIQQIELNMEKARWLPNRLGQNTSS